MFDIVDDLVKRLKKAEAERDALKAEVEAARKQEPALLIGAKGKPAWNPNYKGPLNGAIYASPVLAQQGTPAYSCVYCGCLELEKVTACHCLPQGAEQKWNEHMVFPALD